MMRCVAAAVTLVLFGALLLGGCSVYLTDPTPVVVVVTATAPPPEEKSAPETVEEEEVAPTEEEEDERRYDRTVEPLYKPVLTNTPVSSPILTTAPTRTPDKTATALIELAEAAATARIATTAAENATATAEAPALAATSEARALTLTAGAPTVFARRTAQAIALATSGAVRAANATSRIEYATEMAPTRNARSTRVAATAEYENAENGVIVSAPGEIKWVPDGRRHRWAWDTTFEEIAGRAITITRSSVNIFTLAGERLLGGGGMKDIAIPPHGKKVYSHWVGDVAVGSLHEAWMKVTFKAVDEHGFEFDLVTNSMLKDERK